jgi:hypothetical protein
MSRNGREEGVKIGQWCRLTVRARFEKLWKLGYPPTACVAGPSRPAVYPSFQAPRFSHKNHRAQRPQVGISHCKSPTNLVQCRPSAWLQLSQLCYCPHASSASRSAITQHKYTREATRIHRHRHHYELRAVRLSNRTRPTTHELLPQLSDGCPSLFPSPIGAFASPPCADTGPAAAMAA